MHFRKTLFAGVALLILSASGLSFLILSTTEEDKKLYEELTDADQIKSESSHYQAKQDRTGTSKTLLLSEGDERKIGILTSRFSQIFYAKANGSSELIEDMDQARLVYQESLDVDPSGVNYQVIVTLEAEKAIYFYQQEKLKAHRVFIQRYRIPGHDFPEDMMQGKMHEAPLFTGTSEEVTITFNGGDLLLEAHHLKAFFQEIGLK